MAEHGQLIATSREQLTARGGVGRAILLAFVLLAVVSITAMSFAASPVDAVLQRLGTSVEARIVSLSSNDLPRTSLEMDTVIGVSKRLNANMIFIEVLNDDGYMNYPSAVWPHREGEVDRLAMLIERAHAAGIQVIPWIKTFFAAALGQYGPVLEQHPEWAAVGSDGKDMTSYELSWFNAAHPEARALIQAAILELVTEYAIDGLQLDYIRYPNTYPTYIPTVYGYDDYSRRLFQEETGIDPIRLQTPTFQQLAGPGVSLESLDPAWQQWTVWRENQVTSFLAELVHEVRILKPDFPLFYGVIPALWSGTTYPHARFLLNQHWTSWVEAGYVDGLTPPAYTDEDAVLTREVTNIRDLAAGSSLHGPVMIYPSLMVFPEPAILVREIELLRQMGIPGIRLFSYGRMNLQHFRALWDGPFARPALIPHDKPFLSAHRLVVEIDEVLGELLTLEAVSTSLVDSLVAALAPLRAGLEEVVQGYKTGATGEYTPRIANITGEQAGRLQQLAATAMQDVANHLASEDTVLREAVMKSVRYVSSLIDYGIMIEQRQ